MNFPTPIKIFPTNPQCVGSKNVPKGKKLSYSGFLLKYLLSTGKEIKEFKQYPETKSFANEKKIVNNDLKLSSKFSSNPDPSIDEIQQAINPALFNYEKYSKSILPNIPDTSFGIFAQAKVFTQSKTSTSLTLTTIEVALHRFLIMNIFNIMRNDHSHDAEFLRLISFLFKFQFTFIEEAIYLLSIVFDKLTSCLNSSSMEPSSESFISGFASLCVDKMITTEDHFISNEMHRFLMTYLMKKVVQFDLSQNHLLLIALTKTSLPILQINQNFFVDPIIDSVVFLLTAVLESVSSSNPNPFILNKRKEIMNFVFINDLVHFEALLMENFQMKEKIVKSIPDLTIQYINYQIESSPVFESITSQEFTNFSTTEADYFKVDISNEQIDDQIIESDNPVTIDMMVSALNEDKFISFATKCELPFKMDDLNISNFIQAINMNQDSSYIQNLLKQFALNIFLETKIHHNMKSATKFILLLHILKMLQRHNLENLLQLLNTSINGNFINELSSTFVFEEQYFFFTTPLTDTSLTYLFMNIHTTQYPLEKMISIEKEIPSDLELYENARKLFVHFICSIFQNKPKDVLNMIKGKLTKETIPEVSNWFIGLLRILFSITPDLTTKAMSDTDFFNILGPYLKRMHRYYRYYLKNPNMSTIAEFSNKFRLNAMMFTIQMFRVPNSKKLMLSSLRIIDFLFEILYEEEFIDIVLTFIQQGLQYSDPIRILTLIIRTIRHCTSSYKTKPNCLKLLNHFLISIASCLNQQITNSFIETNLYSLICQIPQNLMPTTPSNENIILYIVNNVLLVIGGMAKGNRTMKKKLVKVFKDQKLANTLSQMKLNKESTDILLKLIFERDINVNECTSAVIKFNKAIPFVHSALLNKPEYITVFRFILFITQKSFANKIHIYRTNLFSSFLDEMRKYLMDEDLNDKKTEFDIMLDIIQTVSLNFFRPQMLIEILKAFRVTEKKKNRTWIISRFIKIFGNILNDTSKQFDSFTASSNSLAISPSFFHFDGYNSKLTILGQNKYADITNGNGQSFSFVCRFQLEKEYLKRKRPRLLSFILSTNVRFEFYFDKNHLYYQYYDLNRQLKKAEKIDFTFKINVWYTMIIRGNSNDKLDIFINSADRIATFPIPNTLFTKFISFTICNTSLHKKRRDYELICNVASIYLFQQSLSNERIKDIMSLPIEFRYSFKQSTQHIFPNLPMSLFTDVKFEKSLLFVFNANKFDDNQPVNLISSENIYAEFIGCRLPYNSSFLTSIINFGGIEVFLPLIDQVDMPNRSNEENQQFLISLLKLFLLLNNSCDMLELHFTQSNGYKSLAHTFSKLSPYLLTNDVFNALINLYFSLRYGKSRTDMILDFLLNYNSWSKLTVNQFIDLNSICILPTIIHEFESEINIPNYRNVYRHSVPFSYLLSIIVEINNDEIRFCYLQIFMSLVKYTFERSNQEYFINLTFKLTGNKQRQFLLILDEIVEKDYGEFHHQLTNPLFYSNLVSLASQDEITRKTVIKIFINGRKYITKEPIQFDVAILRFIRSLNVSAISDDEWNSIEKMVIQHSNAIRFTSAITVLLPLLAYYSYFASPQLSENFIHQLNLIMIECNESSVNFLITSPNYIENLFYIYLNSKKPSINFSEYSEFVSIFNILFVYLISSNNVQAYHDALTQFYLIEYVTKLDITSFLSQVFNLIACRKEIEDPNVYNVILPDIFNFLFYIPSYSTFSLNSNLCDLFRNTFDDNLPNTQLKQSFNDLKWKDYVSLFCHSTKLNHSFKFRLDSDGKWPDEQLANSLLVLFNKILFPNSSSIKIPPNPNKITYFGFYAMIEAIKLKIGGDFDFLKVIPELLHKVSLNNPDAKQAIQIICVLLSSLLHDEANLQTMMISISEILPKEIEILVDLATETEKAPGTMTQKEWQMRFIHFLNQNAIDNFFNKISEDCIEYTKRLMQSFDFFSMNFLKSIQVEPSSIVIDPHFVNTYMNPIPPLLTSLKNICLSAYKKLLQDQNFDTIESNDVHWMFSSQLDRIGRHIFEKRNRHFDPSAYKVKIIQNDSISNPSHNDKAKNSPKKRVYNEIDQAEAIDNNDDDDDDDDDDENDMFEEEDISPKKMIKVSDSITSRKGSVESKKGKLSFSTNTVLITISKQYYGSLAIDLNSVKFTGTELIKPMEYTEKPNRFRNKQHNNQNTDFIKTLPDGDVKTISIPLNTIRMLLLRSYLHVKEGFELFSTNRKSYFFFLTEFNRKKVIRFFKKIKNNYMPKCQILQTDINQNLINETKLKESWLKGEISTYFYLLYINLFAGRTFNDPTQYPIFPWVLKEFDRNELDFNDETIYRDFSKPIGVIGENKIELATMNYNERAPDEFKEPFHHNIFYSKDFILCLLMIRIEPFTTLYLRTQKYFDLARYPNDIKSLYGSTLANFGCELIPEMFTTPELFFKKDKIINFGNDEYNKMGLPNWVINKSQYDFIKKHRLALESDYVAHNINQWIDLVFGYKQTGIEAIKAFNTYDPYLYPSYMTVHEHDIIMNYDAKFDLFAEIQNTAYNFGIVPNQVFTEMHPVRTVNKQTAILFSTIFSQKNVRCNTELKNFELPYENMNKFQKQCKPIFVSSDDNFIYVIESDSKFMISPNYFLRRRDSKSTLDNLVFTDLGLYVQINDDNTNFISTLVKLTISTTPSKLFCIVGNKLIFSSSWYSMIYIIKIEQRLLNDQFATPSSTSKDFIVSHSASDSSPFKMLSTLQLPSPATIVESCGGTGFLTVTLDSFIIHWSIEPINEYSSEKILMTYKIIPHLSKITAIGSSPQLNLLVSGDEDHRVVVSKLDDGSYLHSFISTTSVDSILVDSMPCIVIASNIQAQPNLTDVAQSNFVRIATYPINDFKDNDNNEIVISEIIIDKKEITAWCSIELNFHCDDYVVCCFNDNSMIILSLPMLNVVSQRTLEFRVNHVNFHAPNSTLIFTCSDGLVHYIKL